MAAARVFALSMRLISKPLDRPPGRRREYYTGEFTFSSFIEGLPQISTSGAPFFMLPVSNPPTFQKHTK